jgi:hypothetical protein
MTFRTDRRKHVEESGPFGKSRRGRSRTRPATTAKKEDPHIAYFGEALRFDQGRAAADERQQAKSTRSRSSSQTGLLPPQATSSLSSSGALASPDSVAGAAAGTAVATAAGAASAAANGGGAAAAASATAASVGATASARLHSVYEVLLYGYKPSLQYAALQRYETISRGNILEDYARQPPSVTAAAAVDTFSSGGGRRFRTMASFPAAAWRALTHDERQRVNTYAGGECWIKVTFDSALAGERAVAASPQAVHDYWVYAEPYRDQPPHRDAPIPVVLRGAPGGDSGVSGAYGTAAGDLASRGLRRPGNAAAMSPGSAADDSMSSSSTASSATATGYAAAAAAPVAPSRSELYRASAAALASNAAAASSSSTNPTAAGRIRTRTAAIATAGGPAGATAAGAAAGAAGTVGAGAVGGAAAGAVAAAAAAAPEFCTAIPTARRIRLRPAEEAVLPARTLAERLAPYVPFMHLLPGGGDGGGGLFSFFWGSGGDDGGHIPRLPDGRLDYERAGVYWKLCFWIDHFFHTDLCGLKED